MQPWLGTHRPRSYCRLSGAADGLAIYVYVLKHIAVKDGCIDFTYVCVYMHVYSQASFQQYNWVMCACADSSKPQSVCWVEASRDQNTNFCLAE